MTHTFARLRLLALGGLLAVASPAVVHAQKADASAKLPTDPAVTTGKLSNGLTYYIRPNHKPANKVELRLVVKAGSILENNDQLGLAHFMEHMNFNGSKNFPKNDLVSYLQSIGVQFGADLNAYTAFDQTVYILPIPTDKPGNLEKGFQIIEDWAHNALLTDKDIDEERGVVLEESRLGKGAQDRMLKKFFPKLAEGSLYADRLPIGKDEILKTFKYDKIRSFYHDWYRPDLQAVVVVGDIDLATAKKMIEKHFAGIKNPANERPRKYVDITPRKAPEAMVVTDSEATNTVVLMLYPYTKKHEEKTMADYRAGLVRQLAMSVMNQRLDDLSKSSNPPFAQAGVDMEGLVHGYESLSLEALVGAGGPDNVVKSVTAEIKRADKFGFNADELDRAKKSMLSNIEKAYNEKTTTESHSYVEEYISAFLDQEPFPGVDNEYNYQKQMLPSITAEEVNNEFRKLTSSSNTFTLLMAPSKSDMKLPTDKQLLDMTIAGFKQDVKKEEEKKVAASLMTTKPTPGKVVLQVKEDGFNATTYTLSNGIQVTIKPTDFKSDEILMNGIKQGGANSYGDADRDNVKWATDLMDNMGYGTFTPTDIEKILAGAKVEASMKIDDISDNIECKSTIKDFETMLQLTYLQITAPRKDAALFDAYKTKMKTQLQFMSASPQFAFFDTTIKAMYSNHPPVTRSLPHAADFDNLNMDRAMQIYSAEFGSADGYHFFISGNVSPETALPLLEAYLGSIPSKGTTPTFKDNGIRPAKGNTEVKLHKGKDKKSTIFEMYSGEMPYSEDMALKTKAVAEVINIKVIEIIREKMSAMYSGGFGAQMSKEPYQRFGIQAQLPCGPENVDKVIAAADDIIKDLIEKGPDPKDLDKVKSQWIEKYKTDAKENKYWEDKMESVLFWGRDKDRVLKYEDYVNKLTPAEIQEAAKKLFTGSNKFVSILYPES